MDAFCLRAIAVCPDMFRLSGIIELRYRQDGKPEEREKPVKIYLPDKADAADLHRLISKYFKLPYKKKSEKLDPDNIKSITRDRAKFRTYIRLKLGDEVSRVRGDFVPEPDEYLAAYEDDYSAYDNEGGVRPKDYWNWVEPEDRYKASPKLSATYAFEEKHGIKVRRIKDRPDIKAKRVRINRIANIAFNYKAEMLGVKDPSSYAGRLDKQSFLINKLDLNVNRNKIRQLYKQRYGEELNRRTLEGYIKSLKEDRDKYIKNYEKDTKSVQNQKMLQWQDGTYDDFTDPDALVYNDPEIWNRKTRKLAIAY